MLQRQRLPYLFQLTRGTALILALLCGASGGAAQDDTGEPAARPLADAYQQLSDGGRGADPAALQQMSRAVLDRAIRSDNAFERWAGLRAARGLSDPALVDAARSQLHSGSRYEEALALEILARSDPQGQRDEFVAALDSPYRTVRMRGLRALQPYRDDALVTRLTIVATEDADPDVRVLAIKTLAQWGARSAVASLRRGLDDPVATVQLESARALVALEDPEIVAAIRKRLAQDAPETRTAALRLARLVPTLELLDVIGPLLADPNAEVRVAAAAAVLATTQAAAPAPPP